MEMGMMLLLGMMELLLLLLVLLLLLEMVVVLYLTGIGTRLTLGRARGSCLCSRRDPTTRTPLELIQVELGVEEGGGGGCREGTQVGGHRTTPSLTCRAGPVLVTSSTAGRLPYEFRGCVAG
jgi:hypothetical protein